MNWFQIGKKYVKAVYCHLAYLICSRVHQAKCQAEWNTSWNQDCREKYHQPQMCRCHHSAESEEEIKSLLMKVKEESEKVGLKLTIQKTKIMVSGPITLWQIDGETMETVTDFIFFGSKITADGDCSHEIKKMLAPWKKAVTNLDSISKSRDIFADKGPSSHSYGFSSSHVWMWELDYKESWAQKNWCFWTVVLEKTLENPWTARRSNQSIVKEISPEYSLEGLMLRPKLHTLAAWCEELTHWKRPWCWKRLKAGWEGDNRRWDGWMASPTWRTWVWAMVILLKSGKWW